MSHSAQAHRRRFALCRPDHFDVVFEINPWMSTSDRPDLDLGHKQWESLKAAIEEAGATTSVIPPVPGLADMVFAADLGIVNDDRFFRSAFRYSERAPEAAGAADWLAANGFTEIMPAERHLLEGGDVVSFGGDTLICGHGPRTELAAHRLLAEHFGVRVVSVALVDPRFYHLDMSLCPLNDSVVMTAPDAWDEEGRAAVDALVDEQIQVSIEDAMTFCLNSVVIADTIIMSGCPAWLRRRLEDLGFRVHIVDISEFLKAGGGVRCMTLDLDLLGSRYARA